MFGKVFKVYSNELKILYNNLLTEAVQTRHLASAVTAEDDLLNIFHPPKEVVAHKREPLHSLKKGTTKSSFKTEDVIISCKRPEFNHYKNQKYDKFKPIPLASKGWFNPGSKGDYFTIKISNKEDYVKDLFWESDSKSFSDLSLSEDVINALKLINIEKPTKIQEKGIPVLLSGRNTQLNAETGCGKTLAFLLPAIEQVLQWKQFTPKRTFNSPLVVILTPSRELAVQIGLVAKELSHHLPFSCRIITGGRTKLQIVNPEFHDVDITIATIGAMSKLITTGIYKINEVRHLILDEADSLLDDSFNELLMRNLRKFKIRYKPQSKRGLPENTQLTLVSATVPRSLNDILGNFVEVDSIVKVSTEKLHKIMPHVPQTFYRLGPSHKPDKLLQLVKSSVAQNQPTVIFSNKAKTCDWISLMLNENGVETCHINGDMPYILRQGKFRAFQDGRVNVFSCTDIASRGLDTIRVKHVLNYDFPVYMSDYIHRCGRTGRVGSSRDCHITNFVSGRREVELVNKIELAVRTMEELPNVNANITKIIHHRIMKNIN